MNEVARGFYFVRVSFGLESCLEFASEKCHFVSKGVFVETSADLLFGVVGDCKIELFLS